jgi:alpha-L-fucosidase
LKQAVRSIATALLLTSAPLSYAQLAGSKPDTTPVNHPIPAIQDTETPAQRDARMEWWREARFGMFIHWGLYSIPAGEWHGQRTTQLGECIMNYLSIPLAHYNALDKTSTPPASPPTTSSP